MPPARGSPPLTSSSLWWGLRRCQQVQRDAARGAAVLSQGASPGSAGGEGGSAEHAQKASGKIPPSKPAGAPSAVKPSPALLPWADQALQRHPLLS